MEYLEGTLPIRNTKEQNTLHVIHIGFEIAAYNYKTIRNYDYKMYSSLKSDRKNG